MATKDERAHLAQVASLGCVVCRNLGNGPTPATIHHIRHGAGIGQRCGHYLVIPLCGQHHQHGGPGVALHAGQTTFELLYGTELELLAQTIGDVRRLLNGH